MRATFEFKGTMVASKRHSLNRLLSGQSEKELSFRRGELIRLKGKVACIHAWLLCCRLMALHAQVNDSWYVGAIGAKEGLFPANYADKFTPPCMPTGALLLDVTVVYSGLACIRCVQGGAG